MGHGTQFPLTSLEAFEVDQTLLARGQRAAIEYVQQTMHVSRELACVLVAFRERLLDGAVTGSVTASGRSG